MNEFRKFANEVIQEFLEKESLKNETFKKDGEILENESKNNSIDIQAPKTDIIEKKKHIMNKELFKDISPIKEKTNEVIKIKPESNEELKSRMIKFLTRLTESLLNVVMKEKIKLLEGFLDLKSEPLEERRKFLIEKKTFVIERLSFGDLIFKDWYIYSPKDHEIIQNYWLDILDYINTNLELLNELDTNTKVNPEQNKHFQYIDLKPENQELNINQEKAEELLGFKLDILKEILEEVKKLQPITLQDEELLNTAQAAKIIGYTPQTLRKMVKSGEIIPHKWVSKRPAFLKSELLTSTESGQIQKYKRN